MENIVLQLEPRDDNARNSEGAFVALKNGHLLFAWSKFLGDSKDNGASVVASRISEDGGKTWSAEDRILAQPEDGAHNLMSVSFLRLPDGRILFCYMSKTSLPNGKVKCIPIVRFSSDEMTTLSSSRTVTDADDYYVVNNDRMVQTKDGTIVVPVAFHRFGLPVLPQEGTTTKEMKWGASIFYFLSRDNGETWWESETEHRPNFPDGGGLQEPGVIELKDGRLWSWARSTWQKDDAKRAQWQSFSEDGGRIWSEPEPSIFVSPCSPLSMKRIPQTGDLLAVWNDHSGRFPMPATRQERRPLILAVSSDEGVTWKYHQVLDDEPEHGYCYTAIHFTDDAVLLAYCAGGPKPMGILQRLRMRRIPFSEIYAKERFKRDENSHHM